ncbi:uncharacterized protein LOC132563336 [Ylistrum balloti]|uniref:uncharacterized protein LOC132563336 n=1 Tax=Ylistrum balloti TaxID=509963 RepID=UPI002905B01D|nr:uncharacterized protein LOC132563336 [Ylistrum balloti]
MSTSRPMDSSRHYPENSGSLPGARLVTDTYLGVPRTMTVSSSPNSTMRDGFVVTKQPTKSKNKSFGQTNESRFMKESNVDSGLTILPWEDFIYDPRVLNDLFHLETDGVITYDPEEVNVFFHATRMMKPTFGDVSENGKSWVLTVENVMEMERVRQWLTERVSVFGVTLVKKEGKFGRSQRAPCLIVFDPGKGNVRDQLYHAFVKSVSAMDHGRKCCIEMNLNGCVENWCTRVTGAKCKAVGAKLIITDGEERDNFLSAENIICCVLCLPVWAIQTTILQAHRHFQYLDYSLDLSLEELRLHGSMGGAASQREKLFAENKRTGVFRTKPSEAGVASLDPRRKEELDGHKYICIKKYDKKDNKPMEETIDEHETTTLQNLLAHIAKSKQKNEGGDNNVCAGSVDTSYEVVDNLTDDVKAQTATSKANDKVGLLQANVQVHRHGPRKSSQVKEHDDESDIMDNDERKEIDKLKMMKPKGVKNAENEQRVNWDQVKDVLNERIRTATLDTFTETRNNHEYGNGMETLLLKGYSRHKEVEEEDETSKTPKAKNVKKKPKRRSSSVHKCRPNIQNGDYQPRNTPNSERPVSRKGYVNRNLDSSNESVERYKTEDITCLPETQEVDTYTQEVRSRRRKQSKQLTKFSESSGDESEEEFTEYLRDATILRNIDQERLFTERHYPNQLKGTMTEQVQTTPKPYLLPEEDEFDGKTSSIIPVGKTDRTCLIDNTDDNFDDMQTNGAEGDIELTDCELDDDDEDDDEDGNAQEQLDATQKKKVPQAVLDRSKRPSRYDSTRKYLGIRTPRRNQRPMTTDTVQHQAVYEMELM